MQFTTETDSALAVQTVHVNGERWDDYTVNADGTITVHGLIPDRTIYASNGRQYKHADTIRISYVKTALPATELEPDPEKRAIPKKNWKHHSTPPYGSGKKRR